MLLTPHVLVGVAVARSIPNPFISAPISFVLHFFADKVPHWDFYSNTKKEERLKGWRPVAVMADFGLGIAVGLFFALHALWVENNPAMAVNIILCVIASVLPDALEAPYIFTEKKFKLTQFIYKIQHKMQFQAPLPWGLLTQVSVSAICLLMILSSQR